MGATKTELFTDKQNTLSALFKAMGHPARIAIIDYLLTVDTCICGDIVHQLPLAQPTISRHLKELKDAGLIKGRIEGSAICYCIEETAIIRLQSYLARIAVGLEKKKTYCC
jgi:ArsR family transcriptional regulator, arsenate/arsenite/antimonite-responsive transcriptional repressor